MKIEVPTTKASVSKWTKPSQFRSAVPPVGVIWPRAEPMAPPVEKIAVQDEQDDQRSAGGQPVLAAAPELEGGGEEEGRGDGQVEREVDVNRLAHDGNGEGDKPDCGAATDHAEINLLAVAGPRRGPDHGGEMLSRVTDITTDGSERFGVDHQRDCHGQRQVGGGPPQHRLGILGLHCRKDEKDAADGRYKTSRDHQGRHVNDHRTVPAATDAMAASLSPTHRPQCRRPYPCALTSG